MKNNLEKFLFLAVMIGVTFLLGQSRESEAEREEKLATALPVVLSFESSEPAAAVAENESVDVPPNPAETELTTDLSLILEDSLPKEKTEPVAKKEDTPLKPEATPSAVQGAFFRIGEDLPGEFQAAVVLVSDLKGGENYFEKGTLKRWPIASITKLMTATVALEKIDKDLEVTISEKDFEFLDEVGKVKVGEKYTVKDLIEVMLGTSSNEAAEALANAYGREGFILAMNDKAKDWGLANTYFKDPTGISVSNQSTAKDLKSLARNILQDYPEVFGMTRQSQVVVREINSGKSIKLPSNNLFAGKAYFLGGKTGYIDESEGNLLSLFSYGGRPVFILVLGTQNRFEETEQIYNWFRDNYRI